MTDRTLRRLDWPGLTRAGLHELGLTPKVFWDLTPVELMVMLGRDALEQPESDVLTRNGLEALLRAFPDQSGET